MTTYRPGQKAPHSGQYEVVGRRGGSRNKEVTSTKGNPLPPTKGVGRGLQAR
ncbi:YjzC family protein [Arthrobacter mangrovi]|uniref:YjzC family protein n=1 Tax=Arthrobacter mangrovi TaxID=2966350 RepID=UPI0035A2501C